MMTTTRRSSFRSLTLGILFAGSAWLPAAAQAGTVKGVVHLPEGARSTRLYQGYWRLENGNVPVQSSGGAKAETVVVLEGTKGAQAPAARTVTVEIGGLDARPRLVVVGPGSVVELKNTGKVTHEFSTPDNPSFMPVERLPPGTFRRQKFTAPGGYLIRCSEYPHIAISVIVVDSPHFGTLDEKGSFSIPSVPEGHVTLKIWTRGRWAYQQEIDAAKKDDLSINVAAPKEREAAANAD
jgi:plastocyanin